MDKEIKKIYDYCTDTVQPRLKINEVIKEVTENIEIVQKTKPTQLFNDPIHGSIELNDLEQAIVHTPEFFRLKDIKQLGGTSFVYPGATHTRFEHSIGVCYIAGQFVDHLMKDIDEEANDNGNTEKIEIEFTKKDRYCIRVAALCHDLGHGPFSHMFESVANEIKSINEKKLKHEDLSKLIFKKILVDRPIVLAYFLKHNLTLEHVIKIEKMIGIDAKTQTVLKKERFLYEIVANKILSGMDVDKWDYLARDCHYLGIRNDFNWRRLMTLSKIVEVEEKNEKVICTSKHRDGYHIGYRDKEALNVQHMYQTRCTLHQKAYQHPAGNGIELLIKDVLLSVKDLKFIDGIPNSEVSPKTEFQGPISIKDAVDMALEKPACLSGYIALSDGLLKMIKHSIGMDEKTEKARNLISRLENRKLYREKPELEVSIPFGDKHDTSRLKDTNYSLKKSLKKLDMKAFCEVLKARDPNIKPEELFEIQIVPIKFASEENPDPLKEIFFYKKDAKSRKEVLSMSDEISDINKPKAYMEYRLRFYSKKEDEEEDEMESIHVDFRNWSQEMKGELLSKFESPTSCDYICSTGCFI